jgi:hypothetical protein
LDEGQDDHCFELTTLTKPSTLDLPKDFCSCFLVLVCCFRHDWDY